MFAAVRRRRERGRLLREAGAAADTAAYHHSMAEYYALMRMECERSGPPGATFEAAAKRHMEARDRFADRADALREEAGRL